MSNYRDKPSEYHSDDFMTDGECIWHELPEDVTDVIYNEELNFED